MKLPFKLCIIILISIFYSKITSSQINKTYFDVYDASSQFWSGGVEGSGSGSNYSFKIRFKKNVSIKFDTIWFDNNPSYMWCSNYAGSVGPIKIQKGDSVIFNSALYYPGQNDLTNDVQNKTEKNRSTLNPLPDNKCAALIEFVVDGKKYYYPVIEMKGLPAIAYP